MHNAVNDAKITMKLHRLAKLAFKVNVHLWDVSLHRGEMDGALLISIFEVNFLRFLGLHSISTSPL